MTLSEAWATLYVLDTGQQGHIGTALNVILRDLDERTRELERLREQAETQRNQEES